MSVFTYEAQMDKPNNTKQNKAKANTVLKATNSSSLLSPFIDYALFCVVITYFQL